MNTPLKVLTLSISLLIVFTIHVAFQTIEREKQFNETERRVMIIYYNRLDTTRIVRWTFGYQVGDKILDLRKEAFKYEPIMVYEK